MYLLAASAARLSLQICITLLLGNIGYCSDLVSIFYFSRPNRNRGEALTTSLFVCAAQSAIFDLSVSLYPRVCACVRASERASDVSVG